ncbi:PAAR domain-containing protein [Paraburkholderia kururiensis]|uniref:PAAR domain-containing protein n=1 Tax=Paraburkholderia kururiensis TaxID=984307 RepID=A0ABZ0WH58_9BURK|nr:PAAR domain-containing protein [Paraburkholderia kururiensis]WQD76655.1 PAAR domain-containing protein [Paraburkholderia kururiensis]
MSAFIRKGDTTDHGGRVLACSPLSKVDGKPVARLGDMVSCPKCGGVYPIVQILPRGMTMDGKPPAFEGDKTACGATLIASQSSATAQPTSGPGGHAGPIANHQTAGDTSGPYRGRFQVLDETTGKPIANHPYTLHTADGQKLSGQTDASGYTQWHEADSPASLRFSSESTQSTGFEDDA